MWFCFTLERRAETGEEGRPGQPAKPAEIDVGSKGPGG
jgi:hypothetical protein